MIYIGAENIISPLGNTAQANFENVLEGKSALKKSSNFSTPIGEITSFSQLDGLTKLESLLVECLKRTSSESNFDVNEGRNLVVLSTTKGDIEHLESGNVEKAKPGFLLRRVMGHLAWKADQKIVSNACVSGVLACIYAHDLIAYGKYDRVIVVGADLLTNFTYRGFESFFALSDEPCKPFDASRKGLSLGECVASVALSKDQKDFKSSPHIFCGGASANDANHISGPSRDGEGLFRAISRTLKLIGTQANEVDFISAHGTATRYNDDMESIAFDRAVLKAPINSFKGYFGHTLGAAGVLELILSMKCIEHGLLIKSLGFEKEGTSQQLNMIEENQRKDINTVLKTASGFGGCNAAVIIKKLK
ncbi:3-oxoacyl-[acyl-carrier-protein] synthase-1 [Reichenbachiella faecimaris]|uniref:3-oxoacyl-[acyl-carrier-protein] synthase-1 n=1 Tax=Reichenbachiella faecimaris TaxID=692418 RepID=A0A1W2G6F1_REIFA|nr:beta-ketoacyl synthase N-terminal-like domain-containing protein [Reichenbachiella faecimaris]SMD32181.1 3-oxoacyl-[acyl-carrier-protein] synthase-1 [Reichenbachiella faecimaris]